MNAQHPLTPQTPDPTDIRHYIAGFLLVQDTQGHSARTREWYEQMLAKFVWWLEHENYPTTLAALTPTHIRLFVRYLQIPNTQRWDTGTRQRETLKPRTIHGFVRTLRAFLNWATIEADLPKNPFPKDAIPKQVNPWAVESFTDAEVALLFTTLNQERSSFLIARNRALLSLLLDTGLRASEVLTVTCEQASGGTFTVTGKGGKSRPVILGGQSQREIWTYLTHHRLKMAIRSNALFVTEEGAPLTYWGIKGVFRFLREKSHITRVPVKAHTCRHTFATKAHQNGMRASMLQRLLGHADYNTTLRFYVNITEEDLKEEHAQYGPMDRIKVEKAAKVVPAANKLPPAPELLAEVQESTFKAVARKYGVSDTLIHKRLRKAGIHP
jgi:integrase/recombinase XerD